jgi:hypothetical protein
MVSSQIWLNLPRGDRHFSTFSYDDHHFGFLKSPKKTAPSVFLTDEMSPKIEISGKKTKGKKERRFWRSAVARSEGAKKKVKIIRFVYLLFIV